MFVNVFAAQTTPSTLHLSVGRTKQVPPSQSMRGVNVFLTYTRSINFRHQLIQYKVTQRFHYSHVKLHSFSSSTSPLYVKCKQSNGTLAHMFWFCKNFIDFGMKFSTSTLRFMDMISLQTQRQASLADLTSSRLLAGGRLCQNSMG